MTESPLILVGQKQRISRKCIMPTRYKTEIDHNGFDWSEHSRIIDRGIASLEQEILESLGFYQEFASNLNENASEKSELLREICGKLCLAAAIELDAGFKATGKLVATLKAIKRNPHLIYDNNIEPEALGLLSLCYQREGEELGRYWYDIDFPSDGHPGFENIRKAAATAINEMAGQATAGRPSRVAVDMLAKQLRKIFLRFNDTATRSSVLTSCSKKGFYQIENGKFLKFLKLVLSPLDEYLKDPRARRRAKRISAAQVSRRAIELGNEPSGHKTR